MVVQTSILINLEADVRYVVHRHSTPNSVPEKI
jgi:hypothetical protein